MSRSNPNEHAPNPATRWLEWNGEQGTIRYYDKAAKQNVDVPLPFTFLLLDELSSVRGWHDASESGIYANEVRDTRKDILVVKAFKGGTLAEGLYQAIKDRVNTVGGQYIASCYIAFKVGNDLTIGNLRLKGAALGAWMEFRKQARGDLYSKAITIKSYTEGKKGKVIFRVPVCALQDVSEATDRRAQELDAELQRWLAGYFKRAIDHADAEPVHDDGDPGPHVSDEEMAYAGTVDDSDVPF